MQAVTRILAGGVAAAALGCAAPAAAQYYPDYPGPGYGYGGGYGNNGYGMNQQAAVNQCAAAAQQRLSGGYGYNGYGYNGYGDDDYAYRGAGGGRVLGISRVEPRSDGGFTVRGVAASGRYGAYGYNGQGRVDLTWRCRTDYRGFVVDVDVRPAERIYGNGYNYQPYNPYDYSQYGYRRY